MLILLPMFLRTLPPYSPGSYDLQGQLVSFVIYAPTQVMEALMFSNISVAACDSTVGTSGCTGGSEWVTSCITSVIRADKENFVELLLVIAMSVVPPPRMIEMPPHLDLRNLYWRVKTCLLGRGNKLSIVPPSRYIQLIVQQ